MIYKLQPNRVHRTYLGGKNIDVFCGVYSPEGYMPEDWTASVTSAYDANGNLEGIGKTEDGRLLTDFIGDDNYGLLVKLLDSEERLVIQAHPTVDFAKAHLNSNFGKTECWYFLDCDPDAYVLIGFKEGVTREQWESAFKTQNVKKMVDMLHKLPVKKGDFVFVEGGVPHAIGPGCFMIELQEPSDLMVVSEKVTPSGRRIPDRRIDMGLPFDLMMDVYDYTPMSFEQMKKRLMPEPKRIADGVTEILGNATTDKFKMLKLDGTGRVDIPLKYTVAICVSGNGQINGTDFKSGERAILISENELNFSSQSDFSVIVCY